MSDQELANANAVPRRFRNQNDGTYAEVVALAGGDYQAVAASQTDKALGPSGGAVSDLLVGLLIVPGTTAAGAVSIKDGNGAEITVFAGAATTALQTLTPFFVSLGARATATTTPGWKVTTGANVTAVAVGKFT